MAKDELAELRQEVQELKMLLGQLTGQPHTRDIPLEERADYIEHGSDRHAAWLGLRKATPEEQKSKEQKDEDGKGQVALVVDGWTLQDITAFGVTADKDFLLAVLRQKVSQLTSPVPSYQTIDKNAPDYAPPMWRPQGFPVTGIVG